MTKAVPPGAHGWLLKVHRFREYIQCNLPKHAWQCDINMEGTLQLPDPPTKNDSTITLASTGFVLSTELALLRVLVQ